MGSIRDKIERQERQELEAKLDAVPSTATMTRPQAVASVSVRQRAELAHEAANPEPKPTPTRRGAGFVANTSTNSSVRQRLEAAAEIPESTPAAATSEAIDFYYNLNQQEQLARKKAEVEAEARRREQIEQRKRDIEAEARRQSDAEKQFQVNLVLSDANDTEKARVKHIVATRYPADVLNPERHWMVLQQLRIALGDMTENLVKPVWAETLIR